jgi:hypothetical protein
MGFEHESVLKALRLSKGDLALATDILLSFGAS